MLVYPPLHPGESIEARLLETGDFLFTMFVAGPDSRPMRVFTVRIGGSAGWGGLGNQEVVYLDRHASISAKEAELIVDAITTNIMPGSAGQFGFLSSYNFITPDGWDSLCMIPPNGARPDGIPSFNCLVETDWYPQNTEFRFPLERGESISFTHDTPLGQVLFVPRVTLRLFDLAPGTNTLPAPRTPHAAESVAAPALEVGVVSAGLRGGLGRHPTHENRRAWLPQQTRFCPVVEDVHRFGALLYPPLAPTESAQVVMRDRGEMLITFYVADELGQRLPAFTARIGAGEPGDIDGAAITLTEHSGAYDEASARTLLTALFAGANAPPGVIGIRSAYLFVTPDGVDTVVTSLFNDIVRPLVTPLTTRVQTDGESQVLACWYVLKPGLTFSIVGDAPIGQAFFLPREEILSRDASPVEEQQFVETQEQYWAERATKAKTTGYGATFTYHYRDHQKARRDGSADALPSMQDEARTPPKREEPDAVKGNRPRQRNRRGPLD
ncbi:MAG: hypothetical protein CVU47_00460 [Chloroflexi bacterium HGW-Chloroflexi-9]|nr:MAG: hypothetical protein CVU47_00460 [Chloroflexi bacterium HGW-Chloroflexi-9]